MKKIEKMKKKKNSNYSPRTAAEYNIYKKRLPRNENPQPGSTKNRPKTRVKVKPKELYGKRYTPNLTENKLLKHIVPIVPNPKFKVPKDKKAPVIKNPKFKLPKDGKPTVMIPANRSESTKSTEVRKRLKPLKGSPYYQRWKKK
tara:strand:+ start:640 stop:1071 length:432 start_codon:yes stop_codon:yes gene_type:complete